MEEYSGLSLLGMYAIAAIIIAVVVIWCRKHKRR